MYSSGVGIADIDFQGNVHADQFWMHYSFGNVLLIASQRPDATRVAGFNAWRENTYRNRDVGFVFQFFHLVPKVSGAVLLASLVMQTTMTSLSTSLLSALGLTALQGTVVIMGLPFSIVLLFMMVGLFKALHVEASITSRPFFEICGYTTLCPQVVRVRGQEFLNYRMTLRGILRRSHRITSSLTLKNLLSKKINLRNLRIKILTRTRSRIS